MSERIKYVIFDLDGTLYQNTEFYHDYIRFLTHRTSKAKWTDNLIELATQIFNGQVLPMNTFIKTNSCDAETFLEYLEKLKKLETADLCYIEALQAKDMTYLGDAWAVVGFLGKTLGLLENGRGEQVYRQTRQKMNADGMAGDARLGKVISKLSSHFTIILASNSYEQTALQFLRQLGFDGLFSNIVFSANKPFGLIESLERTVPDILLNPESVVSIGDHAFNDLMPIAQLGGRTVFINPYSSVNKPMCDMELKDVNELSDFLENLIRFPEIRQSRERCTLNLSMKEVH